MRWLTSSVGFVRGRSGVELALAFTLATFQVSLIVLLGAFLVFRLGSFKDLDTGTGILLFLWLWLTSFYWTLQAVVNIGVETLAGDPLPAMLAEGIKRGAMNGMVFFAGLLGGVLLFASVGLGGEGGVVEVASIVLFLLVYLVIGSAVAAIIGGALGFVFAVVYRVLLQFAKLVAGSGDVRPSRR